MNRKKVSVSIGFLGTLVLLSVNGFGSPITNLELYINEIERVTSSPNRCSVKDHGATFLRRICTDPWQVICTEDSRVTEFMSRRELLQKKLSDRAMAPIKEQYDLESNDPNQLLFPKNFFKNTPKDLGFKKVRKIQARYFDRLENELSALLPSGTTFNSLLERAKKLLLNVLGRSSFSSAYKDEMRKRINSAELPPLSYFASDPLAFTQTCSPSNVWIDRASNRYIDARGGQDDRYEILLCPVYYLNAFDLDSSGNPIPGSFRFERLVRTLVHELAHVMGPNQLANGYPSFRKELDQHKKEFQQEFEVLYKTSRWEFLWDEAHADIWGAEGLMEYVVESNNKPTPDDFLLSVKIDFFGMCQSVSEVSLVAQDSVHPPVRYRIERSFGQNSKLRKYMGCPKVQRSEFGIRFW